MTARSDRPGGVPAEVLAAVAAGGAADAGGLPVELLGDFLPVLTAAVGSGRALSARHLTAYRSLGGTAARQGVALRALLDLYLSASWRLWRHLPAVAAVRDDPEAVAVAGEVMLHAVDDAVASLAEGFQLARRTLLRTQESARREFIDDLLTGGADVAGVLRRADGFGLDLTGPHAVAVLRAGQPIHDGAPLIGVLERAVLGTKGDAEALVASKAGRLVVVFPAPDRAAVAQVTDQLSTVLGSPPARTPQGAPRGPDLRTWQIGVGRPGIGAAGVLTAYQEARDALDIAGRLGMTTAVVDARDLLVYHLLLRDRAAITDVVRTLLTPLAAARGGAGPLVSTLAAYFAAGGNAAQTARAQHLSVRAVTYRLSRVRELSGVDPTRSSDQFALHAAVLGAKLLNWPETDLS